MNNNTQQCVQYTRLSRFINRYPKAILVAIMLITAFFGYNMRYVKITSDLSDLLPQKHEYVQMHRQFQDTFGGGNTMFLTLSVKHGDIFNTETLKKVQKITHEALTWPGVNRFQVMSIAQQKVKSFNATAWGLEITPLMWPDVPETQKEMEKLKEAVYGNDLIHGALVSGDGKAALISVGFYEDRELNYLEIYNSVNNLCKSVEDSNTNVAVAGPIMLRGYIFDYLGQTKLIFILTALAMIVLLGVYTLRLRMVVMPVLSGVLTSIWGLGFIGLFGYSLDPLVLVVPLLITARTISHSVQFNERFTEEYQQSKNKDAAVQATVTGLFFPGMVGILTDAAGIAILILIPIPILQKTGIFASYWALTTIITVLFFNPAVLKLLPAGKVSEKENDWFKKIVLYRLALLNAGKRSWIVLGVTLVITILSVLGATRLRVGDVHQGSSILKPESQYNLDAKIINDYFLGMNPLLVVAEGADKDALFRPDVLGKIEEFQRYMSASPHIGGVMSVADLIKSMNMKMHEDNPKYKVVPYSESLVGQLFYLYLAGTNPGEVDSYVTSDNKSISIVAFCKDHTGDTIRSVISRLKNFAKSNTVEGLEFKFAGGIIGTLAAANEVIFESQLLLLILTFVITILFCSIAFKSFVAGILLTIPLAVSNYLVFTYMGIKGIGLNINTLPVATIAIGIGVDYGIYFFSRMQEVYPVSRDMESALFTSMYTTGKAICFTALTVAAGVFLWIFSSLKFQSDMGLLLTLVTGFHLLGTLILLPALILVIKPKVISRC